ncbi:hypothetical protein B0O99DRAFT_290810 [Bisporella sp. PMI_857]|nr:hypothetical protein B0O99DRAFT_290810 [Bisporella sp. PMI_857]
MTLVMRRIRRCLNLLIDRVRVQRLRFAAASIAKMQAFLDPRLAAFDWYSLDAWRHRLGQFAL